MLIAKDAQEKWVETRKGDSSLAEDAEEIRAQVDGRRKTACSLARYSQRHLAPRFNSGHDRG